MTMSLLLQDLVVTIVSFGAAAMLVRRVVGVMRPARTKAPCATCDNCASPPSRMQSS